MAETRGLAPWWEVVTAEDWARLRAALPGNDAYVSLGPRGDAEMDGAFTADELRAVAGWLEGLVARARRRGLPPDPAP